MTAMTLTPNLQTAAGVFARTGSVQRAAKAAGVDPEAIDALLEDKAFINIVKMEQKHLTKLTLNSLNTAGPLAISIIRRIMVNKKQTKNVAVRLQAAKIVVDSWLKVQELIALRDEIDAIKQQLAGAQPGLVIDALPPE